MIIKFATIDISKFGKKIELSDIQKFARQLKNDSIDILTMQGITRYPDIKTRVDIVEDLAKETEMRKSFGETINLGGRQMGNSVFSVYPIRSSENLQFEKIKSTGFEAAMQTIIDCGAQNLVVVSTHITEKASKDDLESIIASLKQLPETFQSYPIIISGNINSDKLLDKFSAVNDKLINGSTGVWFSTNGTLKIIGTQDKLSVFGKMTTVVLAIFTKPQP
jgi:endonuclease/exonuclease/phosphatase family metal-dependent hydrolase